MNEEAEVSLVELIIAAGESESILLRHGLTESAAILHGHVDALISQEKEAAGLPAIIKPSDMTTTALIASTLLA